MSYREEWFRRFQTRTERFIELVKDGPTMRNTLLQQEGALIIEAVIRIAGPESLAHHAANNVSRIMRDIEGLCPYAHDDDPSMHRIADKVTGLCIECSRGRTADFK